MKKRRRREPSRNQIAKHWGRAKTRCWGCGVPEKGWKLTRCHIVPHASGGSSAPSNYFLLCHFCHRDQPDAASKSLQICWLDNRPDYMALSAERWGPKINRWLELIPAARMSRAEAWMTPRRLSEYLDKAAKTNGAHRSTNLMMTALYQMLADFQLADATQGSLLANPPEVNDD